MNFKYIGVKLAGITGAVLLLSGCASINQDSSDVKLMSFVSEGVKEEVNTQKENAEDIIPEDSEINYQVEGNTLTYNDKSYTIIEVEGGDKSGERESNVAVDIGFGDRIYWGLTNEYGQLVHVIADKITLQDHDSEPVTSKGRYYPDEANVPGTERSDLDQGHIIADSLGGVANAYNITPQDSIVNRHGNQAYMEEIMRDAKGCSNFVATIIYPDEKTQIPSNYHYEYILKGEKVVDDFENKNPEAEESEEDKNASVSIPAGNTDPFDDGSENEGDISEIDTNGNGTVTIKEAKEAGYKMPITSDHWLYPYMKDADGDGMVGE